jgi:hypothetical protein
MRIITIERTAIDRFKTQWPCHNFPDSADLIVAAFADNGDLVDYEICDADDNVIVENEDAGTALSAVFDDAKERAIKPSFACISQPREHSQQWAEHNAPPKLSREGIAI